MRKQNIMSYYEVLDYLSELTDALLELHEIADHGETDNISYFMVMEFVPLFAQYSKRGPVPEIRGVNDFSDMIGALIGLISYYSDYGGAITNNAFKHILEMAIEYHYYICEQAIELSSHDWEDAETLDEINGSSPNHNKAPLKIIPQHFGISDAMRN